jgi:hypothetical protein
VKVVIPDAPPGLALRTVEPVRLDDFFGWAGRIVGNVTGGADLAEGVTAEGWPMYLVRTEGGAVAALYRFQDYAAAIIVEKPPAPLSAEAVAILKAVLSRARPDFRDDEAVSLAELWDP